MADAKGCSALRRRAGIAALSGGAMLAFAVMNTGPAAAFGLGSAVDVSRALEDARRKSEMTAPSSDGTPRLNETPPASAAAPAPRASDTASAMPASQPAAMTEAAGRPGGVAADGVKPAVKDQNGDVLASPKPDYYGERAKEVLAAEKKGEIKLHPLQAAAPDYDIMLCEAGCAQPGLQVLSKVPRTEAVSASDRSGLMKSAAVNSGVECIGGCQDKRSGDRGNLAAPGQAPGVMGEAAGAWMTNVLPSSATGHKRAPEVRTSIGNASTVNTGTVKGGEAVVATDAGPAAPLPAVAVSDGKVPEAKVSEVAPVETASPPPADPAMRGTKVEGKSASSAPAKPVTPEDWMARINREREAKKSAGAGQ